MGDQAYPPDCRRERGFTLFELLLTISFVVLVFVPLLSALSATMLVSSFSNSEIIALNLAQSKMEEIKSLSFSNVTPEAKTVVSNFPQFKREVTIAAPDANLKDVSVIVYWTPSRGGEEQVSMETYVTSF